MTTSSPRDQKILAHLQKQGHASIQELADQLAVSVMTVHRDLNRLAAAGMVVKAHGSASLASPASAAKDACAMCGKTVNERTAFILQLGNGEQRRACCAHCGLMLQEMTPNVTQSLTADFLHPHMVSAGQAVYLLQSEVTVCCAPSVLSFGSPQEAEKFQKGFGGRAANMKETIQALQHMMHSGHTD